MSKASYENKRIVVTGGGGFLGSHLCEFYSTRGADVWAIDNFATGHRANESFLKSKKNIRFIEADVCEDSVWKLLSDQIPTCDKLFHFASPASPPHYQRLGLETLWVNSWGLNKALGFAQAKGARLVFASTSEIYGDPLVHPQPETYWGNVNTLGPRSCYDEAKRFGESLIYTWNLKYQSQHGLIRIFNTYGPRMNPTDGRVIINFLEQALRGEPLTVYGGGKQTRSFCYVDDLIDGITRYSDTAFTFPINLGNDHEFSILELVTVIKKLFPQKNLTIQDSPMPQDDPKQRRPDLSRAREFLKWEPRIPLEEGLKRMLNYTSP